MKQKYVPIGEELKFIVIVQFLFIINILFIIPLLSWLLLLVLIIYLFYFIYLIYLPLGYNHLLPNFLTGSDYFYFIIHCFVQILWFLLFVL